MVIDIFIYFVVIVSDYCIARDPVIIIVNIVFIVIIVIIVNLIFFLSLVIM